MLWASLRRTATAMWIVIATVGTAAAADGPRSERRYLTYDSGGFHRLSLRQVARRRRAGERIWSARLSTGIVGTPSCPAGNRGPKSPRDVILAVGDGGLRKLVDLGFVTCPTCRPDKLPGFWDAVRAPVGERYGLRSLGDFLDRDKLPYDASRVRWETLLPLLGAAPDRLYLPGASQRDAHSLARLKATFDSADLPLPELGVYDRAVPGRFRRIDIDGE